MPALHDFALFVTYAEEVSSAAAALSPDERKKCASIVVDTITHARNHYGYGKQPARLIRDAAVVVIPQLSDQHAAAVSTAAEKLRSASSSVRRDGYGVLHVFSNGDALFRAFVAACVDDVIEEPVWRDALRATVTAPQNISTTLPDTTVYSTLALALIAYAVDAGDLVQALRALQRRKATGHYDILSMYGAYISSSFVRALDVLRNAVETQGTNEELRRDGLHALMWNLTALDLNGSPPDVEWGHRLAHNLFRAGTPGDRIYQPPLSTMLASIGASFDTQLAAARLDASRISRRRGVTYVTRLSGRQVLAWAYIVFSIVISCVCAGKNWPRRDNAFERAKDAVDVATLLLVSVFGLVKLTSEDPNALKSLARGRAPVEDLEQAGRFLRVGAVLWSERGRMATEGIQKLLGVEVRGMEWARAQGCCYGRSVHGEGVDTMAAKVETLKKGGFFFLEGVCKRPHFWNRCVKVKGVTMEVASFDGVAEMECELDFSKTAEYTQVA